MQKHSELAKEFIKAAQRRFGQRIRLFQRHAGLLYARDGTPVKPHRDGMFDAYGWFERLPHAIHLEVEFKVEPDELSQDQVAWLKTCRDTHVSALVVTQRRGETMESAIARGLDDIDRAVYP